MDTAELGSGAMPKGGQREGAGRRPFLEDPVRVTFNLEARHVESLRAYQEAGGCATLSEALREVLEALPPPNRRAKR